MLLAEIAKRLEHPVEPAADRAARLAGEADVLADAFRARLADQPEKLAEFERLLALAREIGRITETHNYWIDRMAQARLRAFAMRVGARLVREGVDRAAGRTCSISAGPRCRSCSARREDRRALVAERKADHERWRTVKPPAKDRQAVDRGAVGSVRRRAVREGGRGDRSRHRRVGGDRQRARPGSSSAPTTSSASGRATSSSRRRRTRRGCRSSRSPAAS